MFDLNYISITEAIIATVVGAIIIAIITVLFREKIFGLNKKPSPDTEKEFSAKQVSLLLTEQAREASGFESNKPKTIDPAQKKILSDELNKLEQGLTDFKKLLQDM